MTFKIGDRVRIIKDEDGHSQSRGLFGKIFTIGHIHNYPRGYRYIYELEGTGLDCAADELQLAKIKNTKLARKLYPNAKEEGEWLCLNG